MIHPEPQPQELPGLDDPLRKELGVLRWAFTRCPSQLWPTVAQKLGPSWAPSTPGPLGLPGCAHGPVRWTGPASGLGFSQGPHPPLPGSGWGWGRPRTKPASVIKASVCFSYAPCALYSALGSERGRGRAGTRTRGWN